MADPADIAHLVRRTEFVARPERVASLSAGTIDAAVDDILNVSPDPVPLPTAIDHHDDNGSYNQYVYATQWWFDRMVDSPKPVQEKMTLFWHGHFCSSWDKVSRTDAMMFQNKLFRDMALGNFRTLTQTMALQPAMLLYLDNVDNVKGAPNQNFARELMELFTLGVGNYSEDDVEASARAWTGHGINWTTYQYQFRSSQHDTNNKTFFGTTKNWDGPDIITEILQTNAAKKLQSCKFLTRKLWEFFAYQNPEQNIVDELAQVLYDNDLAVKPWLRALLVRPEFYSAEAKQGLVRTPVDFVVAVLYHTGYRSGATNPQWYVEGMGQVPYAPTDVSGWKPNAYWINTSVFGGRADFARSVTWSLRDGDANDVGQMTISDAVDHVAALFSLDLSPTTRAALIGYMQTTRAAEPWGGWWESTNLLTMAMLTPEFHVA